MELRPRCFTHVGATSTPTWGQVGVRVGAQVGVPKQMFETPYYCQFCSNVLSGAWTLTRSSADTTEGLWKMSMERGQIQDELVVVEVLCRHPQLA